MARRTKAQIEADNLERARQEDGTFQANDPETPVNEAYVDEEGNHPPVQEVLPKASIGKPTVRANTSQPKVRPTGSGYVSRFGVVTSTRIGE